MWIKSIDKFQFVERLGRGVFVSDEDTHTLRLKSELFDLRVGYANPRGFWPNGFQDWIVPLPGVHGSSLCILNFTAKKDKKRVKMDGFWEKCEKIVREGQKSEKIQAKN